MKNLFKAIFKIFLGIFLAILVCGNVRGQCIDNITTEYFQDFEADIIEECWYVADLDGDGNKWTYINNSNYAHSGTWARISYSYISGIGNVNPDNLLYTALFTVPTIGNCDFSWWHRKYSSYYDDYYSVWIYPDGDEYMYRIGEADRSSTITYQYDKISLNDYRGQTIRVIFRHWHSDSQWALLIDDVAIEWDNPLPINLLEFSAEPRYDHQTGVHSLNLLTIRTGYEYNNCEFIVYRSEDAINWDYDNPVCDWDFGQDSAIYNEALDTVINYFTIEHPNGQTYYPVDTIPYPVTYYKLIQRDCDNTTTEYTSEIIVCIANQQNNLIEPYVICDNGPQVVGGSEVCEVFVQNVLGQVVEEFQLQPYQQREVLAKIQGMYLITFVYKYNGEARKKTEKIICM